MSKEEVRDFTFLNPDEPLTPPEVDRHFKLLNNELARAQIALSRARFREVEAYKGFRLARVPLLEDPECPVPSKSNGVTKAQRDEWVEDRIPNLYWAYRDARRDREDAEDYMKRLGEQVRITQSIGANARQSYDVSGRYS